MSGPVLASATTRLRLRSGWMSGPVLASATTRLRLRSGWMSGPVLASATTRLRLRSGWMSGPVLASATTRLRLRSGEDVSAYAQATGTDTSCWPSKVTTSTEATSAGATRAVHHVQPAPLAGLDALGLHAHPDPAGRRGQRHGHRRAGVGILGGEGTHVARHRRRG